jgi:tetratricopeptide (TPR) repeat protein
MEEWLNRVLGVLKASRGEVIALETPTEGLARFYMERLRGYLPDKTLYIEFSPQDAFIPYSFVNRINMTLREGGTCPQRLTEGLKRGHTIVVFGLHLPKVNDPEILYVSHIEGDIVISEREGEGRVKPSPPDGPLLKAINDAMTDKKALVFEGFDYVVHASGPVRGLEFLRMLISRLKEEGKGAAILLSREVIDLYPELEEAKALADAVMFSPHPLKKGIHIYEGDESISVAVTSLPRDIARGRYGAEKYIVIGEDFAPEDMDFRVYNEIKRYVHEGYVNIVVDCVDELMRCCGVSSVYLFLKALYDMVQERGGCVYIIPFEGFMTLSSLICCTLGIDLMKINDEKSALKYLNGLTTLFPLVVMEQVHRADPETLRTIVSFALTEMGGNLLVTFSSQEVQAAHGLKHALLEDIRRNSLYYPLPAPTLSEFAEAIGLPEKAAEKLYRETGGDPTLVMAKDDRYLISPLERAGEAIMRLGRTERDVLISMWLMGGGADVDILREIAKEDYALDELASRGLIVMEGNVARFFNTLVAKAVEIYTSATVRSEVALRLLKLIKDPLQKLTVAERGGLRENALRVWKEAMNVLVERGALYTAADRLSSLINAGMYNGEMAYEGARLMLATGRVTEATRFIAIAESEGYDERKVIALKIKAIMAVGKLYSAYVYAEMHRDVLSEMGMESVIPQILLRMGMVKKAIRMIDEVKDYVERERLLGYLNVLIGDAKNALQHFVKVTEAHADQRSMNYRDFVNMLVVRANLDAGRTLPILEREATWTRGAGRREECVSLLNAMGILLRIQGKLQDALFCYQEALHHLKGENLPLLRGIVMLNHAEALYAYGNRDMAERAVYEALKEFSNVDSVPSIAHANLLLWEITGDDSHMEAARNLARDYEAKHLSDHIEMYISLSRGNSDDAIKRMRAYEHFTVALEMDCDALVQNRCGVMLNYLPAILSVKGCAEVRGNPATPLLLSFIILL